MSGVKVLDCERYEHHYPAATGWWYNDTFVEITERRESEGWNGSVEFKQHAIFYKPMRVWMDD